MIKDLYSVRDTLKGYQPPTNLYSKEVAIREFGNMVKEHPNKDYFQLWLVGYFNDETGEMQSATPELIARGVDFSE